MTPSNNTKHPLWTMMAPPLYSYETPIKFTQTLTAKYCWDSPRVALSARLTSQVRFHWKAGGGRAGSDGRGALYLKIDRVSTRIVLAADVMIFEAEGTGFRANHNHSRKYAAANMSSSRQGSFGNARQGYALLQVVLSPGIYQVPGAWCTSAGCTVAARIQERSCKKVRLDLSETILNSV